MEGKEKGLGVLEHMKRTLVKSWSYQHKSYVQRFVTNLSTKFNRGIRINIYNFLYSYIHLFFFDISTYRSSHTMCTEIQHFLIFCHRLLQLLLITSSQLL